MEDARHIRTYDPTECAVFLKTTERFGGLSNMAGGFPLKINGIHIRTSEALYQCCRFPHLPEVQQMIISERSPMTAKMRSKKFRRYSRPDWESLRVNIMRWCLRAKLAIHFEKFGELLLATDDAPIVEMKTRRADFWGAKLDKDGKLVGKNVLGRLLMELREDVRRTSPEHMKRAQPPDIRDFRLLEQDIQPVDQRELEQELRLI